MGVSVVLVRKVVVFVRQGFVGVAMYDGPRKLDKKQGGI